MLLRSIRNEVLGKLAQLKSEYAQESEEVPLSLDRLECKIRNSYSLERLFAILHHNHCIWPWLSPALEKALELNYGDVHELARACTSTPFFIVPDNCSRCDECDE